MPIAHDPRIDGKPATEPARGPFDVERVRADFPTLRETVHGDKPLAYLDNAATSLKPQCVIDTLNDFYTHDNSNVHRGVHTLSQRATFAFERARGKVKNLLNAESEKEIVFTRGATEALNLVAQSYGGTFLKPGDEILVSEMEHHANIVSWQLIQERTGAVLRVVPMDDTGELRMDEFHRLLGERTKIVSIVHISNALGTVNPIGEIVAAAHAAGAIAVVDGAQSVPHARIDVRAMDADFFVFSGHKVLGPTGIGVLYGKRELLESMPPWQGGGDMIDRVAFDGTTFNVIPHKFEAGTPHIAGAIGLGAAIDYLTRTGFDGIEEHEAKLLAYATERLLEVEGARIFGTAGKKAGVLSFNVGDLHPHDLGSIMDMEGVATRVGHHCAQPAMRHFGISATCRASLAFYNDEGDIDRFIAALNKAVRMLK